MTCLTMEMGGSSAADAKATKHRRITWFQFIEQLSSPNWHIFSPAQQWLQVEMYPQILNCYDSLTNFIFVLECSFQSLGVEWWWTSLPVSLYTCRWLITKCVSLKINKKLPAFYLSIDDSSHLLWILFKGKGWRINCRPRYGTWEAVHSSFHCRAVRATSLRASFASVGPSFFFLFAR